MRREVKAEGREAPGDTYCAEYPVRLILHWRNRNSILSKFKHQNNSIFDS